jgi:hypothetical protein
MFLGDPVDRWGVGRQDATTTAPRYGVRLASAPARGW